MELPQDVNRQQREECAVAILVRDGQVLLAKRSEMRASYPGVWDIVGGHLELGEEASAAVRRELFEELGVTDVALELLGHASDSRESIDYHVFGVLAWSGEPRNLVRDEHSDIRWFPADRMPEPATPIERGYGWMIEEFVKRTVVDKKQMG